MHTWHWHSWQELPYLSCSLLSQFAHGFFTQQFSSHSLEDMTKILHQEALVYRLKQVHGNEVLTPREIEYKLSLGGDEVEQVGDTILAKADGLIGEQPLQAVWTASADCTPALIGDVKTGQVAAVHAGWRGTAKKSFLKLFPGCNLKEANSKIYELPWDRRFQEKFTKFPKMLQFN